MVVISIGASDSVVSCRQRPHLEARWRRARRAVFPGPALDFPSQQTLRLYLNAIQRSLGVIVECIAVARRGLGAGLAVRIDKMHPRECHEATSKKEQSVGGRVRVVARVRARGE